MAQVLPIVKIGTPVLRCRCAEVPLQEIKKGIHQAFIREMIATMHEAAGVGLAANQVAVNKKIIVLECKKNARYPGKEAVPLEVYFNPEITAYSKEQITDWEGCLSIPGYRGLVPRAASIQLEALTPDGKKIEKKFEGFHARILQHEVDHIQGLFYVDRMPDLKSWRHLEAS